MKFILLTQYFKYILIGILSNIISFVIFYIFVNVGIQTAISSGIGMIAGILNTYTMSRLYLNSKPTKHTILKLIIFFSYYGIAIYITSTSIEALAKAGFTSLNVSWIVCNLIASLVNFVFIKITMRPDR